MGSSHCSPSRQRYYVIEHSGLPRVVLDGADDRLSNVRGLAQGVFGAMGATL